MSVRLAIDLQGLSFAYPNGAPVLRDLDWQLPEGAFALLDGATGSGKSTLLRLLKPELSPVGALAGARTVFGRDLADWGQEESAAGIGYVAQDPGAQIVCDTVRHELAFGLENLGRDRGEMRLRVAEVAQFLGLTPLARRRTADLSGGEQQQVAVAGALTLLPRLLLLDEPTAQLDPVAEKNFLHELFRINRELGVTVVVATHEPEACAEYATCAFVLQDGRLQPAALTDHAEHDRTAGAATSADSARPATPAAACPAPQPGHPAAGSSVFAARQATAAPVVTLDDAHYRYGRTEPLVLAGVDLTVPRGSVHALIGGNGSGKSTLLRLIAGVLRPKRGRVRNAAARNQAFLPQDPKALFVCDSLDEELREWQRTAGYSVASVEDALRRTGLDALRDLNPYDLSGGQQQLLALAKLTLTGPDLLLLDEPTKGLDPGARLTVGRELRRLAAAGTTIVFATHDLAFVSRVADAVSLLFDGEVACTCATGDFFADEHFLRPRRDRFCDLWDRGADAR